MTPKELLEVADLELFTYRDKRMAEECLANEDNNPEEVYEELVLAAWQEIEDSGEVGSTMQALLKLIRKARVAALGRSVVVYWPGVEP